jgi:hypothetical protein
MNELVPLRGIATLRLSPPSDHRWVNDLHWIPVSPTEIYLACRYFPLAVHLGDGEPKLGLLINGSLLAHNLLTSDGKWRGAYRPIALRCFPFQGRHASGDPLSDILVAPNSAFLSPSDGYPVQVDGKPNAWVVELHRLLRLLKRGEEFASAIDQFLIAGLLEPLPIPGSVPAKAADLHVISPRRFAELNNASLGAMTRRSFLSLNVAVACLFSLQNLKYDHRPEDALPRHSSPSASATAFDCIVINDLPLALDDGELIPLSVLVPEMAS